MDKMETKGHSRVLIMLFVWVGLTGFSAHADAKLEWMVKAYGDERHNAFTDLIEWKSAYYLCFRHGAAHGSMDGEIRIMRSTDARVWEPCATLDTLGDDRDPHFVTDGSVLYCYFGTWDLAHQAGAAVPDRGRVRSYFAKTDDGTAWSKAQGVYEPGFWLWRVRYHEGAFYSAAYTAVRPKPDVRETRLVRSKDALHWELVSVVTQKYMAGEADMYFPKEGGIRLLTRTGEKPGNAFWFRSNAGMTEWTESDAKVLVHSPVFGFWKDFMVVGGRAKAEDGHVTRFWRASGDTLEELITLPSRGDTSYPGLIVLPPEGGGAPALLVSWYSQHESGGNKNQAAVYVGRVVP